MEKHVEILCPRFDAVLNELEKGLAGVVTGRRVKPDGGYFVTYIAEKGCAKRIVLLWKEAGVIMTSAGVTHPCHEDPDDAYIHIAPSFSSVDELVLAMQVFCVVAKLAKVEKLLNNKLNKRGASLAKPHYLFFRSRVVITIYCIYMFEYGNVSA
ncbi:MAG: hypothetical protein PHG64_13325 [Paludibacter sp.]|jgi:hypothetical protein|nr:hypothetical protein [Paludibacter sp.]